MFSLTITSIDRVLFQGAISSVNCPASEGEVTILKNHAPFITPLKAGIIRLMSETGQKEFPIAKGLLAVHKNETVILI